MTDHSPDTEKLRPHPLADALVHALQTQRGARVLEIGMGSGRNRTALTAAGLAVESREEPPCRQGFFDAAISTHAFLHGAPDEIASGLARVAQSLKSSAPFYATFASVRDARYGRGVRLGDSTFAETEGDEPGVAHTYFTEPQLREMLIPLFQIDSLEERNVDDVAGRWAHAAPSSGRVHFFLIARNRGVDA